MANAPAGWYPDSTTGKMRWWDGNQWTNQFGGGTGERPWYKQTGLLIALGIGALVVVGVAVGEESPPASTSDAGSQGTDGADVTHESDCGYLTGDDRAFTADAMVENPGSKAVTVKLSGEWRLAGGESITDSKRETVPAGESRRIGIRHVATLDQILAHQHYKVGEPCTAEVSTVETP